MTTPTTEPTTEAGQRYLNEWPLDSRRKHVLAIEVESAANEREALAQMAERGELDAWVIPIAERMATAAATNALPALLDERDRLTAALTVEAIAEALFAFRLSANVPVDRQALWKRQSDQMREPFLREAAALRAALLPDTKETT